MRRGIGGLVLLVVILGSLPAADAEETKKPEPDFSREAIRRLFIQEYGGVNPEKSPFDLGFVFINKPGIKVRWLPFVAPLLLSRSYGSPGTTGMPMVDPFTLTNTSLASTPTNSRDRLRDWRERRALRRIVAKADRKRAR